MYYYFCQTAAALLVSQLLYHGVAIEMPTDDLLAAVHSALTDLSQVSKLRWCVDAEWLIIIIIIIISKSDMHHIIDLVF